MSELLEARASQCYIERVCGMSCCLELSALNVSYIRIVIRLAINGTVCIEINRIIIYLMEIAKITEKSEE